MAQESPEETACHMPFASKRCRGFFFEIALDTWNKFSIERDVLWDLT